MPKFFAEVNNIKICYKNYGNDNSYPLICIHGFGSKQGTWMAQIVELSKYFKVITFDLRGCGKSDRPDIPYTMELLADDIKGLMEYLDIKRAHFAGYSMGGMILQNFVIKYPQLVNKLIFINTNARVRNPESIDAFVKTRIERLESLRKDPVKVFWRDTWFGFYFKFRKQMEANPKKKFHDIFSVEDLIKYIQKYPPTPQDIKNQAHALKTHDVFDKLKQIQNKSLVLAASHDKLVPESIVQEIHKRIPNSIFKVINKAGHESHKSNAPEVNKIILDFLLE